MNAYLEAAKLMALVQRAGARHNAGDNALIQQAHDILMGLGAKCRCEPEMMTVEDLRRYAPNPLLRAAVEALVLRHPRHKDQSVHGRNGREGIKSKKDKDDRKRSKKVRKVASSNRRQYSS